MKHTQKMKFFNIFMLTIAGMTNAFGITIFMTPVKLYDSGISGTSMLLEQMTPPYLSLSLFLLILNIPLFLFGLKKTRKTFYFLCHLHGYNLFPFCMANYRRASY